MYRFRSMLLTVLFVLSLRVSANETTASADPKKEPHSLYAFSAPWTPLQLSCTPVSLFQKEADVYGINIALWWGGAVNVCGVNFSGIGAFVGKYHFGISVSGIFAVINRNYGISIAPANLAFDNSGIMLGLANMMPDGDDPKVIELLGGGDPTGNGLQIGFFNDAESGFQIGVINRASGFQIGLINHAEGGFQIGLINHAESGFQIGLVNYNPNSLFVLTPLLNWARSAKKTTEETVPKK